MMILDILGVYDHVACTLFLLVLIFTSDRVKIYLGDLYIIRRISLSFIFLYWGVFLFEPFLESY
jgi:hypothetical protein